MQVKVDLTLCNGYGNCVMEAPDVFDLDDASGKVTLLRETASDDDRERLETAALVCPMQAITLAG